MNSMNLFRVASAEIYPDPIPIPEMRLLQPGLAGLREVRNPIKTLFSSRNAFVCEGKRTAVIAIQYQHPHCISIMCLPGILRW